MARKGTQRFIAFLRAINVGGHTVKMERLRAIFESLGLTNVETFIASGNVIFETRSADAGALEAKIERGLEQSLGYEVATFLRTPSELSLTAQHWPFAAREDEVVGSILYVAFLPEAPRAEARKRLLDRATEIDQFDVVQREVYWLCHKKLSESDFSGALLEKILGVSATIRNISTVRKLAAKYPSV